MPSFALPASLAISALLLALQSAPQAPTAPKAPPAPKAPASPKAPAKPGSEQDGSASKSKTVRAAGFWYGVPKAPEKKKGAIRVAAYNVENVFDGVDDPSLQGEYDDIKMTTKPGRLEAIADAIRRLDADVLCIEEIEGLDCLKWFRDTYLKGMGYDHAISEDVGYYRGVEQACLSRYPIASHATYVQEDLSDMDAKRVGSGWAGRKADQGAKFQRSPLRVDIDVDGYRLTLFSVHFKAGGREFSYHRESEALQVMQFIDEILAKDPAANVAVLGDFNASPSDKTPKVFAEAGMRGAYDFRGTKKGNTKDLYTTHDSGRAIDYVYMTKGMAEDVVDSSFFVLSTVHPASDYDWRKDPDKTKIPAGYASDHYPIAIDLMPKDRDGAGTGAAPGKAGGKDTGKGKGKGGAGKESNPAAPGIGDGTSPAAEPKGVEPGRDDPD
jgi:endonuclease/exonuclease/phosphatase family metal-dependent hydrolase